MAIFEYLVNSTILGNKDSTDKEGVVALEKIKHVAGSDSCAVVNNNNHMYFHLSFTGKRLVRRSNEAIVQAARDAFDKAKSHGAPKYNLKFYNCEHFAMELRYGVAMSVQTGDFNGSVPKDDL
ncbi:phospholipase A and acyltransferase 3 isoform X2 [Folsomia candida]|nr:phospholipase A and acyltransferase 3 isoform X2 [Folsomia candida]XP_035701855.1 phospholipase A and acyltransferase 3 isoform X2 [Folsomia candida]